MTSSLRPRNCAMPELLKSLNQLHPLVGQLCCLLQYEHSHALKDESHFQGPFVSSLLQRKFCCFLVGASKPLPVALFLCKAQRNPHKVWGFSCFCSGHKFNEKGIFPDHLIYFEVHLLKLPHKSPSPMHAHFQ